MGWEGEKEGARSRRALWNQIFPSWKELRYFLRNCGRYRGEKWEHLRGEIGHYAQYLLPRKLGRTLASFTSNSFSIKPLLFSMEIAF